MTRTTNYLTTTVALIAMLSAAPALAGGKGHGGSHHGGGMKHSFSGHGNSSFKMNNSFKSSNVRRSLSNQATHKQPLNLANSHKLNNFNRKQQTTNKFKNVQPTKLHNNHTLSLGKTNSKGTQIHNTFKHQNLKHNVTQNKGKQLHNVMHNGQFTKNLHHNNGNKFPVSKHWNGKGFGSKKNFCFPNYCSPKHPWCKPWYNNWCRPWNGGCYFPTWCGGYYPYYGGVSGTTTIVQPVVADVAPAPAVEEAPAPVVQAAASEAIDLEVLEVRQIDRGDAAKDQGPAYAVMIRNTTGQAVAQPFTVALAASIGRVPAADAAFAAARVEGLEADQPRVVEVRLPAKALKLGVNADGQPVPFAWLTAVADSQMEVEQADRENDYTTINRSEIVMVAMQP